MVFFVLLAFLVTGFFYSRMPEQMVSGWDYLGRPNRYLPRFWGLFLMPLINLLMVGLFSLIPQIDPLKENVKKFQAYFDVFIISILLFLFYLQGLVLAWNLGYRFNMVYLMILPFVILFWIIGVLLEKSRRNWFIGVRTPWTISSDLVWRKTNRLGGKLFKASSLITLIGFLLPDFAFLLVVIPSFLATVFAVVYSYFVYRVEKKK